MKKNGYWWALGVLFLLAIIARIIPGPRIIDDAYITFRYARNVLTGHGFVYNIDETVLGTSTPLYTLVLILLGSLSGGAHANFPNIAWALNALLDGLSVVLLVKIGELLGGKWSGWAAGLAWAIAPFSVTFAIGGLETSFYVLLLISAFWTYLRSDYVASALLAGLSLLTRPDALLLLLPLSLHRLVLSKSKSGAMISKAEWIALTGPILLWGIFASVYFGSPIPHSVLAKSEAYLLAPNSALVRLLQHFATPFQGHLSFGTIWIGIGLFLFPFLAIIGSRMAMRNSPNSSPFVLFPWLYFLAFAIANPLIFRWYLTPPLAFYFLFILLGLESLLSTAFTKNIFSHHFLQNALLIFFFMMPSLLLLNDWQKKPTHGAERPAPAMAWIELELLYQKAADFLIDDVDWSSEKTVAAGDVGVLGYFTEAYILDLVGLNSPQTLAYFPLAKNAYADFVYAIPSQLVFDAAPDYLVFLEIYGRNTLLKDADFYADYFLLAELKSDIYGSKNMLIYKRLN